MVRELQGISADYEAKMDVIEVIDGAFKDFQQMWADIGYTEEDQIKEVNEFVGSITKLCTDKVERLKEEKEQMMLDVTHSIDQIKKLAKQLDDGEVEIVLPLLSTHFFRTVCILTFLVFQAAELAELPLRTLLAQLQGHIRSLREVPPDFSAGVQILK